MPSPIDLKPIGVVESDEREHGRPYSTHQSAIRIFAPYRDAMLRMEEHSHFWILSWFDQARRDRLQVRPGHTTEGAPLGVFALRAPMRPNPIGLSLVRLDRIEGDRVIVTGLDAFNGTPVLDIKPYFEQDIIFSPLTPFMPASSAEMEQRALWKQAVNHHREVCPDLEVAVRMAMLVEERLGKLQADDLTLEVQGSPCLADVLQGLTRARLAAPPRFTYLGEGSDGPDQSSFARWRKGEHRLLITLRPEARSQATGGTDAASLFDIDEQVRP